MIRLTALAAALALAFAGAADAHRYAKPRYGAQHDLETKIAAWRVSQGMNAPGNTVATLLASIAIQQANYQEAKYSSSISGVPFQVWTVKFFPQGVRGMIRTVRCHGRNFGASAAFRGFLRSDKARNIMGLPFWSAMTVRSVKTHQHEGWYKGKGKCIVYYVLFAGPLAEPLVESEPLYALAGATGSASTSTTRPAGAWTRRRDVGAGSAFAGRKTVAGVAV